MAGSVNKAIIVGSLGRDPEVRRAQDGTKIVTLNVATSENWKDKNSGERKEKTEWHRVSILNDRLSDVAERYLKKGSKVYLEGKIQTRKWTDQSGAEKYTTEIVIGRFQGELTLLDSRVASDGEGRPAKQSGGGGDWGYDAKGTVSGDLDDSVPFAHNGGIW